MMRIAIFFMAFLAVLVLGLEAPVPNYAVTNLTWTVDPFNNGTTVQLSGTVEQVHDALVKINPDTPDIKLTLNPDIKLTPNPNTELNVKDHAGEDLWHLICGGGPYHWSGANYGDILKGIDYLRGVGGTPSAGPGPGACARVSCSYHSAIWWCNDNPEGFHLSAFDEIADCGARIADKCPLEHTTWAAVVGQWFNEDQHWNCIVRWDDDHC